MSDALLYDRQRDWFRTLAQLVRDRSQAEMATETAFREGKERADKEIAAARHSLIQRRDKELAGCETKLHETQTAVTARGNAESVHKPMPCR